MIGVGPGMNSHPNSSPNPLGNSGGSGNVLTRGSSLEGEIEALRNQVKALEQENALAFSILDFNNDT